MTTTEQQAEAEQALGALAESLPWEADERDAELFRARVPGSRDWYCAYNSYTEDVRDTLNTYRAFLMRVDSDDEMWDDDDVTDRYPGTFDTLEEAKAACQHHHDAGQWQ
jgi:hypothetical protein